MTPKRTLRRQGNPMMGYVAPLAAAGLSAWAFYGPGRFDETALRLGLEVFGTAAALGAVWSARTGHVALLSFAGAGLALTGVVSLSTVGPLAWLGAALCAVAVVDAAHVADRDGRSLGRVPLVATLVAGAVTAAIHLLL